MRRAAIALLVALAAPVAARAAPPVLLPSPVRPLTATPPLTSQANVTEKRWPGRLESDERVLVEVDRAGRPLSIQVVQRLLVAGVGDYVLAVPAPVRDVRPLSGSAADPGFRSGAVLWQGFSPGGERLAAAVDLRTDAAAASLPLRLTVTRRGGSVHVRIANATAVEVTAPTGVGQPRELAATLRGLRRAPPSDVFAQLDGPPGSRNVRVEAPLRVRGEVVLGGRHEPVNAVLGGGRALAATVVVRGTGLPRVRLTAQPFLPEPLLHLPPGVDGAGALDFTVETLARASRVAQYRTFLANPDPRGRSSAVYEFRTGTAPTAVPAQRREEDSGPGALGIALLIAGAVAAIAGGAVLWSRS